MANWSKYQENIIDLPAHKRAKYGIHFKRADGLIEANFSGKPCHYLDGSIWRPIDTKLILLSDGFYGCPHSDVRIHPDGRVKVEGYQQRAELPSAKTGKADNDKLIRDFSFGSQEMRITEDGFRSEITLTRVPTNAEANKLIASESGGLPGKYRKSLTTAMDAGGNIHVVDKLPAFRAWLAKATYPVVIDPDFAAATGDTTAYSDDADYATAHATGDKEITVDLYTGQMLNAGLYYIYRSVLSFDTSSIGAGTVTQVNLKMTVHYEQSATDFDVQIVKDDWSGHSTIDQKYDGVLAAEQDAAIFCNTAGKLAAVQYTSGNLSTAWVNGSGVTYYGLRSSLDVAETAPSGNDRFVLYHSGAVTPGNRPVLTVLYTAASGIPKHFMYYQRMRG